MKIMRVKTYNVTITYDNPNKKPDVVEVPYVNTAKEAERSVIDLIECHWKPNHCFWGDFTVRAKLRSVRFFPLQVAAA
jgi:hypothetical protein